MQKFSIIKPDNDLSLKTNVNMDIILEKIINENMKAKFCEFKKQIMINEMKKNIDGIVQKTHFSKI